MKIIALAKKKKKVELMSHRKSIAEPRRDSRGPRFHPSFSAFSPGVPDVDAAGAPFAAELFHGNPLACEGLGASPVTRGALSVPRRLR